MSRRRRKKNLPTEPVEAHISALAHDGRGVAHIDGKTVFISGTLIGEKVLFRYVDRHQKFDEGVAVEIIEPIEQRVEPKCQYFGLCGGCSLQHLDNDTQIAHKEATLMELFEYIGDVEPEKIMSPLQGHSWGYRRKARLGVRYVAKKESVLVGFREQRSNFLTDMNQCEVLHPRIGQRIADLRAVLSQLEAKNKIAQIEVAVDDDHAALVFRNLVPLSDSDQTLLKNFAQENNLYFYLQPKGIDSVTPLFPEDIPLSSLTYSLPTEQVSFQFAANDFTQVNSEINQKMVPQALDWLDVQSEDKVLDLFCGLGNFTLPLAKRAKQVVGVEGDANLLQRAEDNAHVQNIFNVTYHAANLMNEDLDAAWLHEKYDKILLDPPRSGALEIIKQLSFSETQRIVYISCNPATLARDAGELVHKKGFSLVQAGVMDMFPHTAHVESMALFER